VDRALLQDIHLQVPPGRVRTEAAARVLPRVIRRDISEGFLGTNLSSTPSPPTAPPRRARRPRSDLRHAQNEVRHHGRVRRRRARTYLRPVPGHLHHISQKVRLRGPVISVLHRRRRQRRRWQRRRRRRRRRRRCDDIHGVPGIIFAHLPHRRQQPDLPAFVRAPRTPQVGG
jgi:hypothetical protein